MAQHRESIQNGRERPRPVASGPNTRGEILAKLVWRVKLIAELEPGIASMVIRRFRTRG
jgi:hypothetical protein